MAQISTNQLRILFAVLYIVIDLIYVYLSKSVYDKAVTSVQGSPMPSGTTRIIAAVGAWACMAVGWYFLTTALVEKRVASGMSPLSAGALAGFINGLVVIGTFNLTLHAMFVNYGAAIMTRDMLWGIGWVTVLTIIYSVVNYKK
jgi:uncharacterized membrane protein